jgi:hypothetical protein
MKLMWVIPLAAMCLLLAACGSSTGTVATSTPAAPSSPSAVATPSGPITSAAPVAAVPLPTSSPTGELTCPNFDQAAAHLLTYAHYASLNVGTNNDTGPTFSDMNEAMGILSAMAPECAPKAVDAITALGVSAGDVVATYRPGDDAAAKAADKAVLEAMKVAGVAAWTAMGKDPAAWDTTLQFVE